MKKYFVGFWIVTLLTMASLPIFAGNAVRPNFPPLDPTLMGFKDQGIWYFLCTAPVFCERIPAHYLTYGPPPPQCPPPCLPSWPGPAPRK